MFRQTQRLSRTFTTFSESFFGAFEEESGYAVMNWGRGEFYYTMLSRHEVALMANFVPFNNRMQEGKKKVCGTSSGGRKRNKKKKYKK